MSQLLGELWWRSTSEPVGWDRMNKGLSSKQCQKIKTFSVAVNEDQMLRSKCGLLYRIAKVKLNCVRDCPEMDERIRQMRMDCYQTPVFCQLAALSSPCNFNESLCCRTRCNNPDRDFTCHIQGIMCVLIWWTFTALLWSNRHVSEMKQNLIIHIFNTSILNQLHGH